MCEIFLSSQEISIFITSLPFTSIFDEKIKTKIHIIWAFDLVQTS